MYINNDLIRNVMLSIETHCNSETSENGQYKTYTVDWRDICRDPTLYSYQQDEIKNCILYLSDNHLIECAFNGLRMRLNYVEIKYITPQGYELLNTIREDTIWNALKSKIGTLSNVAFPFILETLKEISITELKRRLGF